MRGTGTSSPGGYWFLTVCQVRLNGEAVINRFANSAGMEPFLSAKQLKRGRAGCRSRPLFMWLALMFWCPTEYSIRQSVKNALALAQRREFAYIVFPLIGAGVGGYPPERAMEFMREEVANSGYGGEVRIVRFIGRP